METHSNGGVRVLLARISGRLAGFVVGSLLFVSASSCIDNNSLDASAFSSSSNVCNA